MHSENISIPRADGKGNFDGVFSCPDGDGPFPGLIVIHEIFGLNDNIREIAQRFTQQGYATLAVDLFANRNARLCMMQAFYGILVTPLKNGMLSDLKMAMDAFAKVEKVDPQKIGAVGFCMGGGYAMQLAATTSGLKAASVFYGSAPKPLSAMANSCPILGSYPEKDFTSDSARELEKTLTRYEIPNDIRFYQNTQHSFFNHPRNQFEVDAAKDSWQRMLAFFEEHLLSTKPQLQ